MSVCALRVTNMPNGDCERAFFSFHRKKAIIYRHTALSWCVFSICCLWFNEHRLAFEKASTIIINTCKKRPSAKRSQLKRTQSKKRKNPFRRCFVNQKKNISISTLGSRANVSATSGKNRKKISVTAEDGGGEDGES